MGTYLAEAAIQYLDEAQAELERHLVTRPDGRCTSCGGVEPCRTRERLGSVFALYGRLPKRRPGVTRAGPRDIPATDRRSWFAT